MTKFFDPKEEVIDIKITSYGKHLLSKGKLAPHYYAFFDDDIIYDLQWAQSASIGEPQNDVQGRIQDETPRIKAQAQMSGVETNIKRAVQMVRNKQADLGAKSLQPLADKHFALPMPLGTSTLAKSLTPAWDAFFMKGKITDTIDNLSDEASPHIRIPQIDCGITYKGMAFSPSVVYVPDHPPGSPATLDGGIDNSSDADTIGAWGGLFEDFDDGSRFKVYKDSIIIELNEHNTDYLSENFDIEVYEIQSVTGSNKPAKADGTDAGKNEYEELVPLHFGAHWATDLGVSYLTDEHNDLDMTDPEEDPNYVEYFFEVNVDQEIDPDTLCAYLPNEKTRRKSLAKEFECPDDLGRSFRFAAREIYTLDPMDEGDLCD